MISTGLKKIAAENGMKVSCGVAYGRLFNYAATMFEGSGYKAIIISTRFTDALKKQELMNELEGINLSKEYRVQSLKFNFDNIEIVFLDNPGTLKKLKAFIEFFMPLLPQYGATTANICTHCGMEMLQDNWKLINGVACNVHQSCAERINADAENEALAAKEEGKGSYFSGLIGALLGGIIGAIPWAIVLFLGYMASVVGILIGWLAERGYRLLKGKNGKGKIVILAVAAIVGVVLGTFAVDWFTLSQMISSGELAGFAQGDVPYIIITLFAEDPEYVRITLSNIGLGILFAFLGEWFFLKRAYKETKGFKMKDLQ